jgi:hypothetical protein
MQNIFLLLHICENTTKHPHELSYELLFMTSKWIFIKFNRADTHTVDYYSKF